MILLTGDLHGDIDIRKLSSKNFPHGKSLTKDDFLIITGDFGLIWSNNEDNKKEQYWLDWLNSKPWTTLFVDGNHENFERLNRLPSASAFGGTVGIVEDSIFYLRRGEIYTIEGKKFFTFGGAMSTDKETRNTFISWWPEEVPNYAETNYGLDNLENHGNKVDYVITHTAPQKIVRAILSAEGYGIMDDYFATERLRDPTTMILSEIDSRLTFKKWFFGHMHEDVVVEDKYVGLYENIIELGGHNVKL